MAKHHGRIITPCFDICTFAIFDPQGLGNASLDHEIAEIAATIPGEICVGLRKPRQTRPGSCPGP
jgi:hypothetical protein